MARMTRRNHGRPGADAEKRTHTGKVIRRYRMAAGMDQAGLAACLGVSKTAVGNWELGLSRPDMDTVPALCEALRMPVTELLGMPAAATPTAEEKAFLDAYRALNTYNRKTAGMLVDRLLFQQDAEKQDKLRKEYVRVYQISESVSAGVGVPMEDGSADIVYARRDAVPAGADRVMRVNGASMSPTYRDGDLVYVDSCAEMRFGQIGIFIVNGEALIKEYQPDGLKSHNPKYPSIQISDGTDVRCRGRVLGRVEAGDLADGEVLESVAAAYENAKDGEAEL